jgi:hypothetical protein
MLLEQVWKSTGGLYVLQKFYKIIFRENGLNSGRNRFISSYVGCPRQKEIGNYLI